jgi:hypothetical protein
MAEIQQPKKVVISKGVKTLYTALMFIGVIILAIGFYQDAERAMYNYVIGLFYFVTLALGGLFFSAIQHVSNAGWSVTIRRLCESLTAFLPVAALLMVGLLLGASKIYKWMDAATVAQDFLLSHKAGYLNGVFFAIRLIVFAAIWVVFAKKIVGNSLKQDETGDEKYTLKNVPLSIAFIALFALSYSFFSVDTLMSLEPHWFSTIFGVYAFAGLFQTTMAVVIIMAIMLMKSGHLKGFVTEDHLHDLGKYMFAFTVFWAYIAFSQYMLIWYANLPEETIFFKPRSSGSWGMVSILLLVFKFIVPFFALLPRWAKRTPSHLLAVSGLLLVMQYVDLYWLVVPNFSHHELKFGLIEVGIFAGFAGVFLFSVSRFIEKHNVVAYKDPRLKESLDHHVIY